MSVCTATQTVDVYVRTVHSGMLQMTLVTASALSVTKGLGFREPDQTPWKSQSCQIEQSYALGTRSRPSASAGRVLQVALALSQPHHSAAGQAAPGKSATAGVAPMSSGKREMGHVVTLKENFGFLLCASSPSNDCEYERTEQLNNQTDEAAHRFGT